MLRAFALSRHEHHRDHLAPALHQREHVHRAHRHLHDFVTELIRQAAEAGDVRSDIAADELATYCLHALGAAGDLPAGPAVARLVALTWDGLTAGRE